jgi:peptidyl-prolyl cis-trans isomerase SurA
MFLREWSLPAARLFFCGCLVAAPQCAFAFSDDAAPNSLPAAAADLDADPESEVDAEPAAESDPDASEDFDSSPTITPVTEDGDPIEFVDPEEAAEASEVGRPLSAEEAASFKNPASAPPADVPAVEPPTRNVRLVDAVVASVDGVPVTYLDLKGFEAGRGLLTPGAADLTDADFLDVMIEERLFEAEFELAGITADDEDTQAYIDQILENNKSSQQAVELALAQIGLSWDDYFSRMRFEVQKLALINREVRTRANVTDEDVERYWKKAPEYQLDPRVEISHIYIALPANGNILEKSEAENRAQEAWAMAKKSGFEKAAAKYSDGPTADDGGKLGEFEYGTMAPHFEEQVALLEEGEHGEPFVAAGAIHIIRVDEIKSTGRVELVEVQEEIRTKLYNELLDTRFRRWLNEDLYDRHHVTKKLDQLDDLVASSAPAAGAS